MSISVRIPAAAIGVYRRVTPSLWFGPALYAAGGMLLVFLVGQIGKRLPESVLKLFPSSEPETVRGVLKLAASSTLTVATVTFSILIVVLTMTASNFSPRALAGFMRDRTNQNTLGILLGSFSFGATGILLTRLEFYDGRYLGLILLTTLVLGFLTLGALVYFIHHTATSVQITDLVLRLHHEADHALSQFLRLAESEKESNTPAVLRLFQLAVENDVVVHVLRHAGEFAARRRPLCQVWPAALVVVTLLGVLRDLASVTNDRARRQLIGKMMRAIAELALEQLSFEREREQVQHAMGRLSFDDSDMPDSVKLLRQRRKI